MAAVTIIYDGECPLCRGFVSRYRLAQAADSLDLIDAREHPDLAAGLARQGMDLNEGFVARVDGALYHGDEALRVLALMGTRCGLFNRLNAWVFRDEGRARALYPALKAARGLALRALGKGPISPV